MFQQEINGILKEVTEGNIAKGLFAEVWARLRIQTRDVEASRIYMEVLVLGTRGGSSYRTQESCS